MNETQLYLSIAFTAVLAICALAMTRTRGALVAGLLIIMSMCTTIMGVSYLRGTPKAATSEVARPSVARVLWYGAIPNERIYLLLTWEGQREPRYYWVPWTAALEKSIDKGQQNAKANQGPLMVRDPFGGKMGDMTTPPQGGSGGKQGVAKGNGRGKPGGVGGGNPNGDNEGAEAKFYTPPPPPLPEKNGDEVYDHE